MAMFPPEMPGIEPTMDDRPFWDACAERRLRFQACDDCGLLRHPPTPACPDCTSVRVRWVDAPRTAVVYTFTVIHHASHPAVAGNLPYVVAVVEFPGLPGVRLVTNVTGVPPAQVRIGLPLELWWDDIGEGRCVPRFTVARPASSGAATPS
jgi:uncharacterized OB-fold protein